MSASNSIESNGTDMQKDTSKPVVCVFCGASSGTSPTHMEAARTLARVFHENSVKLVYGGGTSGIMGELAKTLVSLSGPDAVHGVIPTALVRYEAPDQGSVGENDVNKIIDSTVYGKTTLVKDMHTRKGLMTKLVLEGGPGSGFVAISGGFGTMEELFETATWNQLGIHAHPVVILNIDGFYDGMLQWIQTAVNAGFIASQNQHIIKESKTAEGVIDALLNYTPSEARFTLDWNKK